MAEAHLDHPTTHQLAAHALGLVGPEQSAEFARHLERCAACRSFVETTPRSGLIALSSTQTGLAAPPPRPDAGPLSATLPPEGARPSQAADASFALSAEASIPAALANHPRYEILQLIGSGGMGVVYKARHRLMDRVVALKVIHPVLVDRPGMVARFEREVRAAARLAHPNIVAAYDAGHWQDIHFFVMEYVEGTDLECVAAAGPLPVSEACGYARQAALGLQHAHERGMVHRDVKPHNLMLTPHGQVKILDFGLARFVSETHPVSIETDAPILPSRTAGPASLPDPGGQATAGVLTSLTPASGVLVGTADYAAPEVTRDAHRSDVRADLYSLGCTLYRLLTGQVPFPGGGMADKLRAHRHETAAPADELRPDLPAGLVGTLQRLMAKDPARRYQTPAEAAAALAPFVAGAAHQILVVDDDPTVRQLMRLTLEQEGYAVAVAEDGLAALEQLRAGLRPEVILLDLMMPVMDGWQFLRELRHDPRLSSIPAVLITGADAAQAAALARGAAACLRKPVAPEELSSCLHQYVATA
jgi:serine/threonine protein kinase